MQLNTSSDKETAGATATKGKRNYKTIAYQLKGEYNNQAYRNESIIRRFSARSEWSDTYELLGWVFLLIIVYIVGCEVIRYGFILIRNIPEEALLRRYQWLFCVMISIGGSIVATLPVAVINICVTFTIEDIILFCVKRYYVAGKQSYKWWQTQAGIRFISVSIITFIWLIAFIELSCLMWTNLDWNTITEDRSIIYGMTGLVIVIMLSIEYINKIRSLLK